MSLAVKLARLAVKDRAGEQPWTGRNDYREAVENFLQYVARGQALPTSESEAEIWAVGRINAYLMAKEGIGYCELSGEAMVADAVVVEHFHMARMLVELKSELTETAGNGKRPRARGQSGEPES